VGCTPICEPVKPCRNGSILLSCAGDLTTNSSILHLRVVLLSDGGYRSCSRSGSARPVTYSTSKQASHTAAMRTKRSPSRPTSPRRRSGVRWWENCPQLLIYSPSATLLEVSIPIVVTSLAYLDKPVVVVPGPQPTSRMLSVFFMCGRRKAASNSPCVTGGLRLCSWRGPV
jgi:hypothetical protein